jgi:hypothetical protein
MRNLTLTLFLLSFILVDTFGQSENTYRTRIGSGHTNQQCNSATLGVDGYIYIAGSNDNNSFGETSFHLMKVNQSGDSLWTKNWGVVNISDYIKTVIETNDNCLLVLGKIISSRPNNSSYDIYVSKNKKENGEIIWFKTFGGTNHEIPESIISTSDKGFIILATVRTSNGDQSILIKINSDGQQVWTKSLSLLGNIKGSKLLSLKDEGFIFVGAITQFEGGDTDIIFIKFDENGNQVFYKTFGEEYNEKPLDICSTSDNSFIISGKVSSLNPYDFSYYAFFLKIDSNGEQIWYQSWTKIEGNSIIQTSDGNIVVGCSFKDKGNYSAGALKIKNEDGTPIWDIFVGQENWDSNIAEILELPDKSLVLIGETRTDFYDILICRINSNGTWSLESE